MIKTFLMVISISVDKGASHAKDEKGNGPRDRNAVTILPYVRRVANCQDKQAQAHRKWGDHVQPNFYFLISQAQMDYSGPTTIHLR